MTGLEIAAERRLEEALRGCGIAVDAGAADSFVRGVAAAPPRAVADWSALLDPVRPGAGAALAQLVAAAGDPSPSLAADRTGRLTALREAMTRAGLDGLIVPRSDRHQQEYVPRSDERLAWLTGFTGSAGFAAVLLRRAAVFVDGRYTLQVRAEVPDSLFEIRHLLDQPMDIWLKEALPDGGTIGYDPWLHTLDWIERLQADLESTAIRLAAVPDSPLDAVWTDRPPPPLAPMVAHDLAFAGRTSEDKRAELAAGLRQRRVAAAVLTKPESIAWLLNVRGGDVPHTPVALSFALLFDDGTVSLFIDPRKPAPAVPDWLGPQVAVAPEDRFGPALDQLGAAGRTVLVDPASTAVWVIARLTAAGAVIRRDVDPCLMPKAGRNPVELEGCRAAHRRDGVAMVRFLHWLDTAVAAGTELSECAAADRLLAFRREGTHFRDLSFETISAAGANGAIVHYRADPAEDHRLRPGTLYLIDSGAQYLDGTTDVTRTLAIGPPSAGMAGHYTAVLRAHIALATVRFPVGTTGTQLDSLPRRLLWDHGLDYDHGTGHGVGSYLGVHEGPQRISKMPSKVALQPGMILSNEPGYYRAGAYGIRLENLVAVRPCDDLPEAERPMLAFETLTLVPFDRRLIVTGELSPAERAWIDRYHARVRENLSPHLDHSATAWLLDATEPLG